MREGEDKCWRFAEKCCVAVAATFEPYNTLMGHSKEAARSLTHELVDPLHPVKQCGR